MFRSSLRRYCVVWRLKRRRNYRNLYGRKCARYQRSAAGQLNVRLVSFLHSHLKIHQFIIIELSSGDGNDGPNPHRNIIRIKNESEQPREAREMNIKVKSNEIYCEWKTLRKQFTRKHTHTHSLSLLARARLSQTRRKAFYASDIHRPCVYVNHEDAPTRTHSHINEP